MSTQEINAPQLTPEDLHYTGPTEPALLGRNVVLAHDREVAKTAAIWRADKAAEPQPIQRREQPDGQDAIPQFFYTDADREAIGRWETALIEVGDGLSREEQLAQVRKIVGSIDVERYGEYFDSLFERIAPPVIKRWVQEWRKQQPDIEKGVWLKWLTESSSATSEQLEEVLRQAPSVVATNKAQNQAVIHLKTDDQLINFLQWYNHRQEILQQHPEFEAAVERQKQLYLQAVATAEQAGWLSEGSLERAEQRLLTEPIDHFVADDIIAASFKADAYAYPGISTAYTSFGGTAEDVGDLLWNVEDNAMHEFNHAVLGSFGSSLIYRWLDEALTEHIALVLKGQKDIAELAPEGGVYHTERLVLWTLIHMANRQVKTPADRLSIEGFVYAYSLGHTKHKQAAFKWIENKLNNAYGFAVLEGISGYLKDQHQKLQNQGVHDQDEREEKALESLRYILAQQPEKLQDYVADTETQAA